MKKTATYLIFLFLVPIFSCHPAREKESWDPRQASWEEIEEKAKGSTVTFMMWQGDPLINAYMQSYVVPTLKKLYDIDLQLANGQGNTIVQILLAELEASKPASEIDMMWINGETFYQLRQIQALFGPWTQKIPNARLINFENPFIGYDFQQPIDGMECPWGNVQMALIYNSAVVQNPPRNREELQQFVQRNPGKFTFDAQFTGMTFLKALLIDIAGGKGSLDGPFNEAKYNLYSEKLWEYIRSIQPFLWKKGLTFPDHVAPMHQMYANGEIWFTMSNNDSEVDNKVHQGLFPETSKAYVMESGTIQNSHYLGIASLAPNKAGAMVVANFLIDPEAQWKKQNPEIWGDGTILDLSRLDSVWIKKFRELPGRKLAPPRDSLLPFALRELAPEYMIRLAADFRRNIIQQ